MNRHLLITSIALITCITGQLTLAQDAEACSCKQSKKGIKGIYPSKGTLPANAKGITVVATHWPRHSQVVSKEAYRIKLQRKAGDKAIPVEFEVRYLGKLEQKQSDIPTSQPKAATKQSKQAIKKAQYLETMQQYIYLIQPRKGFKRGATYQLEIDGGQLFYRRSRRVRKDATGKPKAYIKQVAKYRPGKRQHTATITISKKKLRSPKGLIKPKVKRLNMDIQKPGNAGCSIKQPTNVTSIDMKIPKAYKEALIYQAFVNGKPWRPMTSLCSETKHGRSAIAQSGEELVYKTDRTCAKENTIEVVAMLPGTDQVWWFKPTSMKMKCNDQK